MAELKHGTFSVQIPDELMLPEQAGKMDALEVARVPKAPRGLGQVCEDTADSLEKAAGKFAPPIGVSPETLRLSGMRAEKIAQIIRDGEVVLHTLRQANLLFDHDAYEQTRKVNDQVKAQAKHAPEIWYLFRPTRRFFAKLGRRRRAPSNSTPPPAAPQAPVATTSSPAPAAHTAPVPVATSSGDTPAPAAPAAPQGT